jgi:hypothetical protein
VKRTQEEDQQDEKKKMQKIISMEMQRMVTIQYM